MNTWADEEGDGQPKGNGLFRSSDGKFIIAESLFSYIASSSSVMKEKLSHLTFLLPSQQLGLYMKWFDALPVEQRIKHSATTVIKWGIPPVYQLDLNEFPRGSNF